MKRKRSEVDPFSRNDAVSFGFDSTSQKVEQFSEEKRQYSTAQYSTAQHSTVQYSTVQYSTVQYSTVYSTVQYHYYTGQDRTG